MNLLLLLSALMSAIAGMGAGPARAPVAAAQVVQAGEAAVALTETSMAAIRPLQPLVTITGRRVVQPVAVVSLPATPLYASRRRE